MNRPSFRFLAVVCGALIGLAALLRAFWPLGPVVLIYSPQTTYLLGPLHPDGTVDYHSMVEKALREGITPENNAAIPLIRALGPECIDPDARVLVLQALGLAGLDAQADYLVAIQDHARSNGTEASESGAMDYALLDGWLEANRKPLELVAEAAARVRFYYPPASPSDPQRLRDATVLVWSPEARSMLPALSCRARKRLAAGDPEGAWQDVLTIVRLGFLLAQDWAPIIHFTGYRLARDGAAIACEVAVNGRLTVAQAERMAADLSSLPSPRGAADLHLYGRYRALDTRRIVSTQGARRHDFSLDPNIILRQTNVLYDLQQTALKEAGLAAQLEALATVGKRLQGMSAQLQGEARSFASWRYLLMSSMGRRKTKSELLPGLLISMELPVHEDMVRSRAAAEARVALARVALALAAWRAEHGAYPSFLSELVPTRLAQLPLDVFTDRPPGYRREGSGYVTWSVGPNRVDDGGLNDRDVVVRADR